MEDTITLTETEFLAATLAAFDRGRAEEVHRHAWNRGVVCGLRGHELPKSETDPDFIRGFHKGCAEAAEIAAELVADLTGELVGV